MSLGSIPLPSPTVFVDLNHPLIEDPDNILVSRRPSKDEQITTVERLKPRIVSYEEADKLRQKFLRMLIRLADKSP